MNGDEIEAAVAHDLRLIRSWFRDGTPDAASPSSMITYDVASARFNYRVAGVILHDDRLLLQRAEEGFWFLPGGRCELLESATTTLKREMQEEFGVEVHVERLMWIVENFFEYGGMSYHELGLYFLTELSPDSHLHGNGGPFTGSETGVFQWHALNDLDPIPLQPAFLRYALRAIPETTQHIVHRDG